MAEPSIRIHSVIHGTVQGVGFRMWVARFARHNGIAGWVQNLADGSVELEAEGPAEAMHELQRRVRRGPPHAVVRKCVQHALGSEPLPDPFEIRRDRA